MEKNYVALKEKYKFYLLYDFVICWNVFMSFVNLGESNKILYDMLYKTM